MIILHLIKSYFNERKTLKKLDSCLKQNDVSGRCIVQYQATKGQVTRTKILDSCKTSETGFTTFSKVSSH